MSRWHLIVDVAECHNCNNCVIAAKDELVGNDFPGYSAPHPSEGSGVIRIERQVRGSGHHIDAAYLPRLCQHCGDAPCVKAGGGAVTQRPDGIVLFDPIACRGRRDLVDVCPYGAVVWNEESQVPQTWFFDAHLLDQGWAEPRCVTVCPTRALQVIKIDAAAMQVKAASEGLRQLQPELGCSPGVYYRNLHRIDSVFVAGTVVSSAASDADGVEGADVELLQDGSVLARARSDAFGDFRLDGLCAVAGRCNLRVAHPDVGRAQVVFELGATSVVLDDIPLGHG
jgi:Fe-S-cluster-containing dehydrogenase component